MFCHIPQKLDLGVWRPGQNLVLFVMFLKSFLKCICSVCMGGDIILLHGGGSSVAIWGYPVSTTMFR